MTAASVSAREVGNAVVAAITGDVDVANVEALGQALRRAALTSGLGLVVDLTDVAYIDSSGITMLFAVRQELERSRLRLAVTVPDASPVRRLLKVTAFDEVVPTLPAVDDAVAALETESRRH